MAFVLCSIQANADPQETARSGNQRARQVGVIGRDRTFILKAAEGGTTAVALGGAAARNAQNAAVKKLGKRMVTDYSKTNSELVILAAKKGVALKEGKIVANWKSDWDYMDMLRGSLRGVLAEFQGEIRLGGDPDVKKWAAETAKMIQRHLELYNQTAAHFYTERVI